MTSTIKTSCLIGAAFLMLGASLGAADAMQVAPLGAASAGVEQAAYLHRHYPGDNSARARAYRHAHRKMPNRYCRQMPSRCS